MALPQWFVGIKHLWHPPKLSRLASNSDIATHLVGIGMNFVCAFPHELVVPAARLRSKSATIVEAAPHHGLPEWRSPTHGPACALQAGLFSLARSTSRV